MVREEDRDRVTRSFNRKRKESMGKGTPLLLKGAT